MDYVYPIELIPAEHNQDVHNAEIVITKQVASLAATLATNWHQSSVDVSIRWSSHHQGQIMIHLTDTNQPPIRHWRRYPNQWLRKVNHQLQATAMAR